MSKDSALLGRFADSLGLQRDSGWMHLALCLGNQERISNLNTFHGCCLARATFAASA
jgi:hypothetical protein